jgi:hypothetical protein
MPTGRPGILRCPRCIRAPLAIGVGFEQALHERQLFAMHGVTRTGKVGTRDRRPVVEVRHAFCGHVWMTNHASVREKGLHVQRSTKRKGFRDYCA